MKDSDRTFLPAAGHDLFLPLYDPIVKIMGGEKARMLLLDQAQLHAGQRVLDIGCGTGSFVLLIQQQFPDVEVAGIDPDPKALARAKQKADLAGASLQLERAFSDVLPYQDSNFDRVFSSLMFHHLEAKEKIATLAEVRRVLKPGGSLHLLDFTDHTPSRKFSLMRLFHSHAHLKENTDDHLLTMMSDAGLQNPAKLRDGSLFLMHTAYYRAAKASVGD